MWPTYMTHDEHMRIRSEGIYFIINRSSEIPYYFATFSGSSTLKKIWVFYQNCKRFPNAMSSKLVRGSCCLNLKYPAFKMTISLVSKQGV